VIDDNDGDCSFLLHEFQAEFTLDGFKCRDSVRVYGLCDLAGLLVGVGLLGLL
jgi:hypothetical protein